ncbi:MAG: thiamine pyrophosphate-dependent enzyme, partial [Propionibacteriaceae bacterium]|nr:thiamine pyrophosphate-dependent enzyme [Propionibacteriaceae bacterium]
AVLIVDNSGYGEIRNEMVERNEEPLGVHLPSPDFPALARSLGCHGVAVNSAAELTEQLLAARQADRPTVLVVPESGWSNG